VKKTFLATSCCLAAAAIWSSCTKKENISCYQQYEVDYQKTDNIITLSATLKIGNENGRLIRVSDARLMTVNGINSKTSSLPLTWDLYGTDDVNIVFRKFDRNFINSVKLSETGDIALSSSDDTVVYRDRPLVIHWTGSPQGGDRMEAAIMSGDNVYPYGGTVSASVVVQADSAVWSKTWMNSLEPGKYKILLWRERTLPLAQNDGAADGKKMVKVTIYRWIEVR